MNTQKEESKYFCIVVYATIYTNQVFNGRIIHR